MPLPDVSGFDRLAAGGFGRLGERLRAVGLTLENASPVMRICENVFDPLRPPMRRYHLRQRTDLAALAMRLFLFADPIPIGAAREVFGELSLDSLLDAGLLVPHAREQVACPFHLHLFGSLLILCDDLTLGGDAVMGAGNTTADLCRAVRARSRLSRALDLGCGAGTLALYLSSDVDHVVATDINPRALVLARANAALNHVTNVEFRRGDLFEPVEGELFDLVVSQPPFVPQPDTTPDAAYLYGGRRGDELPSRLLAQVSRSLAPGGRAVVLVTWPSSDEAPLEQRVRDIVSDASASVLVLAAGAIDLDDWCSGHAAMEEQSLGEPFERRALELRGHLDRMQIRSLRLAFNVVARGTEPAFTRRFDILPVSRAGLSSAHVDALLATSALIEAPDAALLEADVCLPDGAELVERSGRYRVQFSELFSPIELSPGAAMLVAATEQAANVREAIAQVLAKLGQSEDGVGSALEGVRQALVLGVLQAPPHAASSETRC